MLRLFSITIFTILLTACSSSSTTDSAKHSTKSLAKSSGNHNYALNDNHITPQGFTGKTYYVSPDGDNSNNGLSETTALKSVQAASNKTNPGDTVLVMNGTYKNIHGRHLANIGNSGTAKNWIRYANYPGHTPFFKVSSSGGFYIEGASYILIEGFKLEGPQDDVKLEYAEAEKEDKSNNVTSNTGISLKPYEGGGQFRYSHHIVIQDNEVSKFNCNGIGATRADYLLVQRNHVHHNAFYSPWACSGISTWSNWNFDKKTDRYRVIFRNNLSYSNRNYIEFWMQKKITDGNGIIIDALKLDQGVIQDGYKEEYNGHVLIENNLAFNNGGRGINIYHSDNIDVINNTTYNNAQSPSIDSEIGIGKSDKISFYNNIFYAQNDKKMFLFYGSKDITLGQNIFYNADSIGMPIPSNATVIEKDPLFNNAKIYDFTLKPNSPAINSVFDKKFPTIDYTGKSRIGETVDLGAFEM